MALVNSEKPDETVTERRVILTGPLPRLSLVDILKFKGYIR